MKKQITRSLCLVSVLAMVVIGYSNLSPMNFPSTVITTSGSTSVYARSQNAFWVSNNNLAGQCTWYAYGRVIELAASGQLDSSAETIMRTAFWGVYGRDAKNWPDLIGGDWFNTNTAVLPLDKRKPGMLVVWRGGSTPGHVAFVEEVSSDLSQYRVSEFNYPVALTYRGNKWYSYAGSPSDCLGALGCPYFYQLPVSGASSQGNGTSTLMNRDGGPPIHPPGSILKAAGANPPTVYLIDSEGRKRGIASMGVLAQLYNQSTDASTDTNFTNWVITVNQSELNLYEEGGVLNAALPGNGRLGTGAFPDGKLIRNPSGEISIVTGGGKRRPFASLNRLNGLGFNENLAVNVSSSVYNSYSAGPPVEAMPLLVSNVNLTPSDPYTVGQNVTGSFSIKNVGYEPLQISSLVVGGRINGVCCSDMTSQSTTLAPGSAFPYNGSRSMNTAATWDLFASYQEANGHWTEFVAASPGIIRRRQVAVSNSSPISVTINTSPSGLKFTVDNINYTAPRTFSWIPGQSHTINILTPQEDSGTRRVFTNWNGGSSQNPRTITPNSSSTYTANFQTQYYLLTGPNPIPGGSVSPGGNWYNAGQTVQVTAIASSGYVFTNWTGGGNGASLGSNSSTNVTMNSPIYMGANFSNVSVPVIPTANAATNITTNSFTANWSSASGSTGYKLDVSTDSSFISFVNGFNNLDVGNTTSRTVSGLAQNTTYYYRVRAYNSSGTSGNSNTRQVTTSQAVPSAPTANPATNTTSTSFTANWSSVNGANGYRLDISKQSNFSTMLSGYNNLDVGNITSRNIVGLNPGTIYYYRLRAYNNTGTSGNSNTRSTQTLANPIGEPTFDFDGDGKTDVSIYRPSAGEWWWSRSSNGQVPATRFGLAADVIAPADFTGDGKTDIAFFRPSSGEWFILRSENFEYYAFPFGTTGDIPVPSDYDGDGKADPAVFRPSNGTWYILLSSNHSVMAASFGLSNDKPVPADYDGDGKTDIGIYRPSGTSGSEWWYLQSSNQTYRAFAFGLAGDRAIPGDFTGDGKADIALFRPSSGGWFVLRSEDHGYYSFPFGATGDLPAPGDYDGDGRLDAAVFRPSTNGWYIYNSTGEVVITTFGSLGDIPIPGAFVR